MKSQSALERTQGAAHFDLVAAVDAHVALVIHPGDPKQDHAFGLGDAL